MWISKKSLIVLFIWVPAKKGYHMYTCTCAVPTQKGLKSGRDIPNILLTANRHKKSSRVTLTPENKDEESKVEGAKWGDRHGDEEREARNM